MFRRARLSPGWSTHVSAERSSKRYPGGPAPEPYSPYARKWTSGFSSHRGSSACPLGVSRPAPVCVSEPTDRQGNRL